MNTDRYYIYRQNCFNCYGIMSVQPDSNGEGGPPPSHTRGEAASGGRENRAARES